MVESMRKLQRNNRQYLDVESFEDYEFTNCLAYEMAIRNDEVINLIKEDIKYQKENGGLCNNSSVDKLLTKYFIDEYYLAYHFFEDIINPETERQCPGSFWNNTNERNTLYKQDRQVISMEHYKGFSIFCNAYDSIPDQHDITTNFKRPGFQTYPIIKEVSMRINFALPEKELIAYISHIKRLFDNNNNLIKSGYELINEISLENGKKISLRDVLSNKLYAADMLYIYDCKKLGYTYFDIRTELFKYYDEVKGIETRTMTEKTIKKYYDIANDYINNRRYKELVTGIKTEELEKHE